MTQPDKAKLKRLHRLERVRAIAKQAAAREAAEAESTLAQLEALAERTRRLAAEYAARNETPDGAALIQIGRFAAGLQHIHETTTRDSVRARQVADGKLAELSAAERRRAVVEDRAVATARSLASSRDLPSLAAMKRFGTGLE
ncbi:MAG: hypothetical protein KDE55_03155 [Novosphingobium sp.]|nr:hypothetical protein [Novosphingobium sp.]